MAGLAAGADAAYIFEEKFNIKDLEVSQNNKPSSFLFEVAVDSVQGSPVFNWAVLWPECVIWLTDERRASFGEDEDNCEERFDSQVGFYCHGRKCINMNLLYGSALQRQIQIHILLKFKVILSQ